MPPMRLSKKNLYADMRLTIAETSSAIVFVLGKQTFPIDSHRNPWYSIGKKTCHFTKIKEVAMENRVEALRRAYGVKQEDLAHAMGVSRQSIGSIENGRYNPSCILAIKLARFFGLGVEEVFLLDGAPRFLTADLLEAMPQTAPAKANYLKNAEIPLPEQELIAGQSTRFPSAFLMGTFHAAFNGSVPVALYNAGILLGTPDTLAHVILELEGNDMVLLDGYGGVDPTAISPYFAAHGWTSESYDNPTALSDSVKAGDTMIIAYWNDRFFRENKGMNTVACTYRDGVWTVYNRNPDDTTPRTYRTLAEALRGKKMIVAYRLSRC